MQRSRGAALPLTVIVLFAADVPAAAPDAAAITNHGDERGAAPCTSCHGGDGGGQTASGFPRLAGLDASYLYKQLNDFASGARDNAVMQPIAKALSEDERKALADYYSQMPVPAAAAKPQGPMPAHDSRSAALAIRGLWTQQLPGCVQCHGPQGLGVGEHFPPLAGQPAVYIANQLRAWKQGARRNDPLRLMQHVAKTLGDSDIQAVAKWFAAQPLEATGDTP
ncbi:c-type cytochrome [Nitrococcus mobilis]|uniref:Cytochrome c-type protein n=1 Tax=Nitrococcus mobilis Nb-231 TaxID=314278 RepID=A4BN79_9GAMM|nr:c-type cytochrome [Nitrococcus mobilis]EAR22678.1 cytochrome c-type protein [Nitrococcus mobilis Nb-231]